MNDWIYFEKRIIGTKHKYINLQIGWDKESTTIFGFNFRLSRKEDHAGLNTWFNLFRFYIFFYITDNRHWCYYCNKFKDEICYTEKHEEKE